MTKAMRLQMLFEQYSNHNLGYLVAANALWLLQTQVGYNNHNHLYILELQNEVHESMNNTINTWGDIIHELSGHEVQIETPLNLAYNASIYLPNGIYLNGQVHQNQHELTILPTGGLPEGTIIFDGSKYIRVSETGDHGYVMSEPTGSGTSLATWLKDSNFTEWLGNKPHHANGNSPMEVTEKLNEGAEA